MVLYVLNVNYNIHIIRFISCYTPSQIILKLYCYVTEIGRVISRIAGDWFQDPSDTRTSSVSPLYPWMQKPSDMEGRLIREVVFPLFSASWSITTLKENQKKTQGFQNTKTPLCLYCLQIWDWSSN